MRYLSAAGKHIQSSCNKKAKYFFQQLVETKNGAKSTNVGPLFSFSRVCSQGKREEEKTRHLTKWDILVSGQSIECACWECTMEEKHEELSASLELLEVVYVKKKKVIIEL